MRSFAAVLILLMGNSLHADGQLLLERQLMSAGGALSAPVKIDRQGQLSFALNTQTRFGYFLWDKLEVAGTVDAGGMLASTDDKGLSLPQILWGIGFQTRYFFYLTDNMYLYVGAGYALTGINSLPLLRHHVLILPGLLFPFSDRVALDLGFTIDGVFASKLFESVEAPRTSLGLQLYF